jgi:septation ring formation regulator EzrA
MNYIHRLQKENEELHQQLRDVREQLAEIERYLSSSKFQGPENDYVHVRTDILPKIRTARFAAINN